MQASAVKYRQIDALKARRYILKQLQRVGKHAQNGLGGVVESPRAILKWAGGKRWLINRHPDLFPEKYKGYYEPFVGSGAILFALRPSGGQISDTNQELINLYRVLKKCPEDLSRRLRRHAANHSDSYYYKVRSAGPTEELAKAARTLFQTITSLRSQNRYEG